MRPLPRLLAFTDDRIAAREDLGVRAAALAAAGPAVGLVARLPGGTADALTALARRLAALARAPMAQILVTGRGDIARAHDAGVVLRRGDLPAGPVRQLVGTHPVLASVHSVEEAEAALAEGADGLIVGNIWETSTHPGRAARGTGLLAAVVALGRPAWAIGGVTPARAREVWEAGAWGVAAIGAAWDADDSYRSALALTAPWRTAGTPWT